MSQMRRRSWLCLSMLLASPCMAEQHALLIGVSDYRDERIEDLEGPRNDVQALRDVLIRFWQFDEDNITTLLDAEATESAIVQQLQRLDQHTADGDEIIIYFSGHGTSASDPAFGSRLHLPDGSGALVSSDFNPDRLQLDSLSTPTNDGLLIGRHELKPRLEALDRDRHLLVMFDACFSGNAARGRQAAYTPKARRFLNLFDKLQSLVKPEQGRTSENFDNSSENARSADLDEPPVYPYDNIVYFGAAAEDQLAVDISQAEIDAGRMRSFDGKAHGGFTDALLRALTRIPTGQQASTELSHARLFNRLLDEFAAHCPSCGHTPVSLPSLHDDDLSLLHRSLFRQADILALQAAYPAGASTELASVSLAVDLLPHSGESGEKRMDAVEPVHVNKLNKNTSAGVGADSNTSTSTSTNGNGNGNDSKGEGRDNNMKNSAGSALQYLTSVASADVRQRTPDIIFESETDGLLARSANGELIRRFEPDTTAAQLQRWLDAREWLKQRLDKDRRQQSGRLQVDFRHPLQGNRVNDGDFLHFRLASSEDSHLLALVLDAQGNLSVLFPATEREAVTTLPARQVKRIPEADQLQIQAGPPWGTDTVLFYALPTTASMSPAIMQQMLSLSRQNSTALNSIQLEQLELALDGGEMTYSAASLPIVTVATP